MARRVEQRSVNEVMRGRVIWLVLLMFCAMGIAACKGSKSSSVEGKLVDWNNKPVAGVKIMAMQQGQLIKGYERIEAVTGSKGFFTLKGLYPSSQYVLQPWSDKWTVRQGLRVKSALQGETVLLPNPMQIQKAYAKKDGRKVVDLATGATAAEHLFTVSADGVITDDQTGLAWVVGPDKDINYSQAEKWVAACKLAGGGWRMPMKKELRALYQDGVGERNMDPAFKTSGGWVWAEPRDSSSAWGFSFGSGVERWYRRDSSDNSRVFGVRSLSR